MKPLILASTSPRRKEILGRLGIPFSVEAPEYEEDMTQALPPQELVKQLAEGKARSIATKHPNAILIGSDLVISLEGKVLGKPHTAEKAKEMLRSLSGRTHDALCGYAVIDTATGRCETKCAETTVFFRDITGEEIDAYIATGEPLDRAGAYAIQGIGGAFVKKIEGDYTCVMGLPQGEIAETLRSFGMKILGR